jgi:peptidoglycan hydrolase CwlO-like protein
LAEIKSEVKEMREDLTQFKLSIQKDLNSLQLTIREISTMLSERKVAIDTNQANIGDAFKQLRELKGEVVEKGKIAGMEQEIKDIRATVAGLKESNAKHGMLYAIVASVLTAGIGAAVLQLFRG